ncbi:MAG: deoxyribonuclease IV [bacterium]|nr:deoxyribonuclease IV [bacterium]
MEEWRFNMQDFPIIGAHVSTAGGLDKGIDRALEIGADAMQIFVSAPQSYRFTTPDETMVKKFNEKYVASGLRGLFFHSIYLMNLASQEGAKNHLAKQSLVDYLNTAALLHADGVVTHIGSSTGTTHEQAIETIQKSINWVLSKTPAETTLILEVTAGAGNTIGSQYEHLRDIRAGITDVHRVKTCWDTQHTFASGYDITKDLDGVLKKYDELVGIDTLKVIHCNDSKVPFGSHKDRHENIGKGEIGDTVFMALLKEERLKKLPFMLEVPGMDDKSGPDKENIEHLRELSK